MAEAELTERAVHAARPVIEVGGRPEPLVQGLLRAMAMREAEGGLASLELRLGGTATIEGRGVDLAFEDGSVLALGAGLKVLAGDERDPVEIFRGTISALEFVVEAGGEPELLVQAEDALMRERLRRATRLHAGGPLRDLVEDMAVAMGLRPVIQGLEVEVDAQLQLAESNLGFLRRLLADHDADLQIVGDELHVTARARARRGEVTLALGSQLQRVHVIADLAHQASRVTLAAADVAQGRTLTATSSVSTLGPGRGRTGAELLEATMGEIPHHLAGRQVAGLGEAQALVDAAMARRARRFVTVQATATGNPLIRVGTHVALEGLGPRFANTYYVTAATHRFDLAEGYVTELAAECAYLGG